MSVCVPQSMDYVLDNLWCRNSKNMCVLMFLPILYGVFYPFSSMLLIVHVQSIYNMPKPLTIICMIFIDFSIFFGTGSPKTDVINFGQNRFGKLAKPIGLPVFHLVYRSD
jgi:hypothetical protein